MDTTISELTAEVTDTNGFTSEQKDATTLSFVDGTRTFEIAPTGAEFYFYQDGIKYTKTSAQDVVVPNTEGLYAIYFDNGTLTATLITSSHQITEIIIEKCTVSYIYWDATNSKHTYFAEERHGISMSPETHAYLHNTRGAMFQHGYGLGDFVINGTGNLNTEAQFSVAGGVMVDEDLFTSATGVASTVGLPVYYLEGAKLKRYDTNAGYPVLTTGTGRLAYNLNTAGTWSLAEVPHTDFVLCHVFAINAYEESLKIVSVVGQNYYGNVGAARAGATSEIASLTSVLLTAEAVPLATVIYQTRDNYSNDVKARIRSTDEGDDYIDWRTTELAQGVNPSSHANLTNLELAQSGVTWGHIDDQAQTIAGEKTFDDGISVKESINLDFVSNPIAPPTVSLIEASGNLEIGDYIYKLVYVTDLGTTSAASHTVITTDATHRQTTVTLPISSDSRVIGRNIYRTKVNKSSYLTRLCAYIPNNTTTEYIDNIADASLGAETFQGYNTPNTTMNGITVNGVKSMMIDKFLTSFGVGANQADTSYESCFIGGGAGGSISSSGSRIIAIGYNAASNATGTQFVAIGPTSGNKASSSSIYIGPYAGYNRLGEDSIAIGGHAGYSSSEYNASGSVGIGRFSLAGTPSGSVRYNTALGFYTGYGIEASSTSNTMIGANTMRNTSGVNSYNTILGADSVSAELMSGATNNVIIGYNSGNTLTTGSFNILIGDEVEPATPTTSCTISI